MRPNASCSGFEEAPPRLVSVRVALHPGFSHPRFVPLGPSSWLSVFGKALSFVHLRVSPCLCSASLLTPEAFTIRSNNRPNHAVWRGPRASTTKDSMTLIRNCRLLAVHCPISWCGLHIRRRKATWIIRAMTSSPPSPRNLDMCVSTCKLDSTISLCTGWYDSSSTGFQPNVVNQVTKQPHVVRQ